jgi:D-alanyl-lipoteichoic acid acyltransferase DltB (MBOAT superfamily)
MLFNSFDFLVFFICVYTLFFLVKGKARLVILFLASCIFYAWFIPEYLLILFTTIGIDYFAGIHIEKGKTERVRKLHLLIGIINTCAVLFIFKYHNFFIDNLNLVSGSHFSVWSIILPIGLSFHVFQSLSYVIEVYRKKIPAERNLLIYSNYVMMFPQLVAGPIERAGHLIPQIKAFTAKQLNASDFTIGATMFFYGLFKKVVVADSLSIFVDAIYNNSQYHSGKTLLVATAFFAIQIYCDFSGYSDMAIGIARIIGFRFNDNFRMPYFSKNVTEFWRRWHISLSSWLRDYIYIPLGGSKDGKLFTYRNLLLTMLIGGLWHGASWNFVIWGAINGCLLSVEKIFSVKIGKNTWWSKLIGVPYTFVAICMSWIFFRATTLTQAISILRKMTVGITAGSLNFLDTYGYATIFIVALLFFCEYFIFRLHSIEERVTGRHGSLFSSAVIVITTILMLTLGSEGSSFIYFQF